MEVKNAELASEKLRTDYEKMTQQLVEEIPYDGLDWEHQFEEYYKRRVYNAKIRAQHRLDMGIGDDYIPTYFPYFGNAIHHVFFGGKLEFKGGTSYCHEVIKEAQEFAELHYDVHNEWMERLTEGMRYCRDNGDGVLLAALRGGNGPMDMANGIMGNNLFMEFLEDEENMHKVMEICMNSCEAMYELQKENASHVCGGYITGQSNLWMPDPMFGQISIDAAHLAGPELYEEFEKPYIEKLADKYQGFLLHTHMMGWKMQGTFADTKGMKIIRPSNDNKYPTVLEKLDVILDEIGDKTLMMEVSKDKIEEIMPYFKGKTGIFELEAADRDDAMEQMERISKILNI
ncbi:MAG: hypothetical protein ACI4TF_10045 [Oliverpabstia sp.]